ncbi:MAG: TolC family protein [Betaproteobacteria bacterium]|nr:TolC family protein [Betaproteobacteria bacterium]
MPGHFAPGAPARSIRALANRVAPFFLIVISSTLSLAAVRAEPLTLDQAWARAEQANPELRTANAGLSAARGQLKDTHGWFWNNPQISTDLTRRTLAQSGLPGQAFGEWNIGLAQTFELAGQHGYRRQAAELELDATNERIAELRRRIHAAVEQRFTRVLALQKRIEIERDSSKLIQDAAAAVKKRVGAGEDSRLNGNLASVEAERAQNQVTLLSEQLIQARVDLAALVQLPPNNLPEAIGELSAARPRYILQDLLDNVASRPLFRALNLREQAARSKLALQRASTYPDITVGVTTGREGPGDARENLTMLSISMPLPLFKRNAGGVGQASAELTQTQIEKQAASRDVEAQVRATWQRLESLHARVGRLTESVLPSLEENQRLSTVSFRSGEIGLLQLLLVNRQLLDGRRDYLDAVTDFSQTRIALEEAAGFVVKDNAR